LPLCIITLVSLNLPLKIALVSSEKPQSEIADLAKIHVTRLSQIVRGRVNATQSERLRIAGVLQRAVDELFPEVAA
jgi:transcriptional regulator with XRE-family HTH domain